MLLNSIFCNHHYDQGQTNVLFLLSQWFLWKCSFGADIYEIDRKRRTYIYTHILTHTHSNSEGCTWGWQNFVSFSLSKNWQKLEDCWILLLFLIKLKSKMCLHNPFLANTNSCKCWILCYRGFHWLAKGAGLYRKWSC